jgi:hypothetical protein
LNHRDWRLDSEIGQAPGLRGELTQLADDPFLVKLKNLDGFKVTEPIQGHNGVLGIDALAWREMDDDGILD